ncbi:sigma-54-dependent Fis family transcriptional regulator [Pseudomonas rubra]|uniref:Sigma-54-dependent Fis family transcriptional regulator n=1 Tax=Pseudomonas rubra TaxID=2942627 RepID=A0ABT5P5U5_9PSED|nr:sigma-54-dependent Fis family transcriptional regulator [Pseudomonas rubra]MDD1013414.1 sigma-54-dependent Fis family transcriptional regulator [Pseudomonas rubra]MDD1040467.1 sigma-54-dependent Fis family transcriptional regulator [Pseudomonas rubra]MDD1155072.1 sigma-54-dependent Fis family transcriptional regulator [Pseudomonas rubra]
MAASSTSHAQLIQASWARCRDYGLEHQSLPQFGEASCADIRELLERQQTLLSTTRDEVMPQYAHLLGNSSYLIMLSDHQGQLLEAWGTRRFIDPHQRHGFNAGACWLEQGVGTNAIGTALASGEAVHVSQDEHFLKLNRFMASAAAPLFDAERQLIGVLDVSSDSYLPAAQTQGLVRMMSQSLENRLILARFSGDYQQLSFNTGANSLDSQWAGLLVFDDQGRVLAANRRADSLLGQNPLQCTLEQLFRTPLAQLLAHRSEQPFALKVTGRNRFHCLLHAPALPPKAAAFSRAQPGCDPRITKALAQAAVLLEKDIPLLIEGETGTGKEVFVNALHCASSRAKQPLIAVNCAAIPAELVESELFGYEKGAFTGAHHKGNLGLIRKADQGIVFLDEIGDMPLPTQARLLRFLQTRSIQPLGSGEATRVDIRVVSATNQNLAEQVRLGHFRQDLYYRIAGLSLVLPPLRERSDRLALIEQIHQQYRDPGVPTQIPGKVLELLLQHPWPGNLRQLASVLQVALALAGKHAIAVEHLPDSFFTDLPAARPQAPVLTQRPQADDLGQRLHALNGNISALARDLGISRTTLYKRLHAQGHTCAVDERLG